MDLKEQLLEIDRFLDFIIVIEDKIFEEENPTEVLAVISLLEDFMLNMKNKAVVSFKNETTAYHRNFIDEMIWALDSIAMIEESVETNDLLEIKLMDVSQLRGHLLKFRDYIVIKKDVDVENRLYIPFKDLSLVNINKLLKEKGLIDKDIAVDLADKHFDFENYQRQSVEYRKTLKV